MIDQIIIFSFALVIVGYCLALLIKKRDAFFRSDDLLLGSLSGVIFFLAVFGSHALDITHLGWALEGDAAYHVVGVHFFRGEPWGFPIGAIRNYGYPYGTGLLGIEGYPFLLLVKLLNQWFPQEPLQFHGIWMLICYVLQGVAGMLLMRRVSSCILIRTLGTMLFIINPIMLLRAGAHTSLMSHFLILFAINLLFAEAITRKTIVAWATVFFFSLWIHVYLLVMCFILLLAFLYKQLVIEKSCTIRMAIWLCVVSLTPCVALFFILNPITPSSDFHKGFGYHSMNLNALINPLEGAWSKFLSTQPWGPGQFEGYNYLGAGIIFLTCALVLQAQELFFQKKWLQENHWLLLLCFALTFYAVSNVVTLGSLTLVHYPNIYGSLAETFRASGRFFWPVWYLILFGILQLLAQKATGRTALAMLMCVIIIQAYDLSGMFHGFHTKFHSGKQWETPLKSANWDVLIKNYARISISSPGPTEEELQRAIIPFGLLAATHNKQVNVGVFSRFPSEMLISARQEHEDLKLGQYKNDTLYVISEEVAVLLDHRRQEKDLLAIIDNYIVFAPGFLANNSPSGYSLREAKKDFLISLDKNTEVSFTSGFPRMYLASGWSDPEEWGTWSDSQEATLIFYCEEKPRNDITFRATFNVFLTKSHDRQHIRVYANNRSVAEWDFRGKEDRMPVTRELTIPASVFEVPRLQLKFHIEKPASPAHLGLGTDRRRLGIGLIKLAIISAGSVREEEKK
jgi:hypothetical protein